MVPLKKVLKICKLVSPFLRWPQDGSLGLVVGEGFPPHPPKKALVSCCDVAKRIQIWLFLCLCTSTVWSAGILVHHRHFMNKT